MKHNVKDLQGLSFGNLIAVKPTTKRSGTGIVWECLCTCQRPACARIVYVCGSKLTNGTSTSCKLQQFDKTIHPAIRTYYVNVRTRAVIRNYIFPLSLIDFHSIIKLPCNYCNSNTDIKQIHNGGKHWRLRANGIDRLDNSVGYLLENCVPCCGWCNRAKDILSQQEYIDHCKKVAEFNDR